MAAIASRYKQNPYARPNRVMGGYYPAVFRGCNPKRDYCYDPRCENPECRALYRWSKNTQIKLGVDKAQSQGLLLRLITVVPLDAGLPTQHIMTILALKNSILAFCNSLGQRLRYRGHSPMWWRVWGIKQDQRPHQLHVHQLFTCTPDCDPLADANLMRGLEKTAQARGLKIHIKAVTDPENIAPYLAHKNLKELEAIGLPPRFPRFQASRNAPQLDYQIQRATRRKAKRREQVEAMPRELTSKSAILYWEHKKKIENNIPEQEGIEQCPVDVNQPIEQRPAPFLALLKWITRSCTRLWQKFRQELAWTGLKNSLQGS